MFSKLREIWLHKFCRVLCDESGEAVILTWNVTNWLTIILMAAIGFFLIGLGMKFYQSRTASS